MGTFPAFPKPSHAFSASEAGQALAGLIVRDAGVPRPGFLGAGPAVSAVAASWKVQVGPAVYVGQDAGAVAFSGVWSAEQVEITSSAGIPSGQARIDLVCWDPAGEALVVVEGVPGTSPGVPDPGEYVPVARVTVQAGDGMVIPAQVVPVFGLTALVSEPMFTAGNLSLTGGLSVAHSEVKVDAQKVYLTARITGTIGANSFIGYFVRAALRPLFYGLYNATTDGGPGRVRVREKAAGATAGEIWYFGTPGTELNLDLSWRHT